MGDVRHEPSMEEILSSIKRIIAEDSEAALATTRPRRGARLPEPDRFDEDPEDVLELTAPEPPVRATTPPTVQPRAEPAPAPAPVAQAAPAPQPVPTVAGPAETSDALVSSDTVEATRHALASLSSLATRPAASAANGDITLEGLVREMLRPMLKEWLDANLPALVESLVAREIARLTGQGR